MKLVRGVGSLEKREFCWMSAYTWYLNEPFSDRPSCVCPVLRSLGIWLNDKLSDRRREAVIGPMFWDVAGTNNPEDTRRRALRCVEFGCERAESALSCVPIGESRPQAAVAAARNWLKEPSVGNAGNAGHVVKHASSAATDAADRGDHLVADAAYAAAYAARAAVGADSGTDVGTRVAEGCWFADGEQSVPLIEGLIRELCAIGTKMEIVGKRDLCELPGWGP